MKSDLNNLKFFYNSYIKDLNNKLSEIPLQKIFKAVKIIEKTIKKKLYLCLWQWRICSNS